MRSVRFAVAIAIGRFLLLLPALTPPPPRCLPWSAKVYFEQAILATRNYEWSLSIGRNCDPANRMLFLQIYVSNAT